MIKRIQKTVLTKKFLNHLRTGTKVIKMEYGDVSVFIAPGSSRIMCTFKSDSGKLFEPLSVPSVSSYIVEGGNFDGFMAELQRRV